MEIIKMILAVVALFAWTCLSVTFLITVIMSAIYDARREKREKEAADRDLELHNAKMNELLK